MTTPTMGTATCPYCAGVGGTSDEFVLEDGTRITGRDLVMQQRHIITKPLIRDHTELLRHRDESKDIQVDRRSGKLAADLTDEEAGNALIASNPVMQEVEIDGLLVQVPTGLRPCFVHVCPASRQRLVLFADGDGSTS